MEEEEIWKDIPGYEGIYKISSHGRVKSLQRITFKKGVLCPIRERILRQFIDIRGYYTVGLCKNGKNKTKGVHQLMAIAFLGHTPCGLKLVPDHKDGNKLNNKLYNIQIVTIRENSSTCFRKDRDNFSSKYVGVYWFKRESKWKAHIKINGKSVYLGMFKTEIEASLAYQTALSELLNKERL
jgi:hypothetical protein